MTESNQTPLLELRDLQKYFDQSTNLLDTLLRRDGDSVQAVDGVSLSLFENESKAVIGESGCGKTTLLMTIMGLHTPTDGTMMFEGADIADFTRKDWKEFRRRVSIVFQDPFNSLDPKLTVREALAEPLKIHNMDDREKRIRESLEHAELSTEYLDRLPKQLSGGELQRVSIARALVTDPDVLLADEPVSMLDVSTQASILNLLSRLIDDLGLSILYISHDLSTVGYVCDEINVMYLGRIVETAPTLEFFDAPKHPYSQALVNAIPIPDPYHAREQTKLQGAPRDPIGLGEGCRFRDRCPERMDVCEKTPLYTDDGNTTVSCHLYYDHEEQTQARVERSPTEGAEGRAGTDHQSEQEGES